MALRFSRKLDGRDLGATHTMTFADVVVDVKKPSKKEKEDGIKATKTTTTAQILNRYDLSQGGYPIQSSASMVHQEGELRYTVDEREAYGSVPSFVLAPPLRRGANWTRRIGGTSSSYVVRGIEAVQGPAGSWACLRVEGTRQDAVRTSQCNFWFAPGLGLVRFERVDDSSDPAGNGAHHVFVEELMDFEGPAQPVSLPSTYRLNWVPGAWPSPY